MKSVISILLVASALALWGFKSSSNTAGTQCDPNTPKPGAVIGVEPAADVTVVMTNSMRFDPDRATIEVGQTVLWNNTSDVAHTVTADPVKAKNKEDCNLPAGAIPFDSGIIRPGQTYLQTFIVPGTYKYFCIPHETMGMTGQVIVNPATK